MDVTLVDVKPHDEKLKEQFPLGKIPAFVGADGYKLHECNAIAIYCKPPRAVKVGYDVCTFYCSVIPV